MKKSEVSGSSEGEDDDTVLSVDSSFLSSRSEVDFNFRLWDSEEMQNTSDDLPFTPIPRSADEDDSNNYLKPPPVPEELELRDFSLWSRVELTKGKRFGPIPAQLKDSVPPSSSVWKVVDERGTVKAWVDILIARGGQWTAFLRVSERVEKRNVCPVFIGGQIYLEVVQDIEAGQELRLSTYDLLLAHDTPNKNGSIRHSGSGHENGDFHPNSMVCSPGKSPHHHGHPHPPPPLVPISGSLADGSPVKEGQPTCVPCDLDFADQNRLNEHIGNSHYSEDSGQGEREYKCPQCPKVFNWKSNLIRHQVAHDESRRYVCENCKKVFTDPSNLQRHIRSQHIGARSHACPECGKTFATSSGLKQHTHIHSSVKPFRCEVCLKAYTQFSNLCRHKRMHATCRMQIKCHKCGQAFSAVTSLSKHKRFCEGTGNSAPSSSASAQSQNSGQANAFEPAKSAPMSLAPPPSNSLLFYPRPGFPLYPPSLFAYPIFSGPGLPAPPPLIPDTGLLGGQNANAAAAVTQTAQEFQRNFLNNAASVIASSSSKQDSSSPTKTEKRHSEASESEASEELSSDTGGEDVSSISEGESEADTVKSPQSTRTTSVPSNGEPTTMFPNHRQGSPKQGSVCPDPTMILSPIGSNGPLRQVMNNGVAKTDHDMPFDLSQANKIRIQDEASGFHHKCRDDEKAEEQPLDLRVSHKKSFSVVEEEVSKANMFNNEKTRDYGSVNPAIVPSLPTPMPQLELPKPHSPIPQSPGKLHMAYPRPIHPMFLESMYRLQQEKPSFNLFPTPDRIMAPFPPRYPFLGPLLGTSPSFDFMRAHMEKVGKPMHEMMSPHLGKAKERYSCKFCGKIFPRSANLTRHLRTHTGEQPYKCKYCERSFSISSNLQRHVRNIHNKEKPFKCPLCDRCFGQQTNLDRHLKKHEADGPTILDDSPKTIEVDDKDETYFDEIRNFIGKVTNSGHMGGHPVAPMSLVTANDDRKRDHLMLMTSMSPRQHSPTSGQSENLDDETDGISPSDQEEEPTVKKHRSSESLPASSPSNDSNRSGNSDNSSVVNHLRNGDVKLNNNNHHKALTYEVMMSLNRKLEITNGAQENLRKITSDADDDLDDDDDERKDSSDDEIDPVKDEDADTKPKKTISAE